MASSEWVLAVYNSSLTAIANIVSPTPPSSKWMYQSVNYTVPTGGAYVMLYAQVYQPSGSTVIWVDDGFMSTGTAYYHGDHLGSARVMSDTGGNVMWSATYLPFGQEWNPQPTVNHYKFTGKERDSESGLDNFGARYDSSQYGRFMTPDEPLIYADKSDPQSWNLYSYVRNNPVNAVDKDGHDCVYLNDSGNGVESIDHNSNTGECNEHGGLWANGTVEKASWVQTDPNSNTVHIYSHYKDVLGQTWAGPGWSNGDKNAQMIPQLQAKDARLWGLFGAFLGFAHPPGVPLTEEDETAASTAVGSRRSPLDMGPEGAESLPPTNSRTTLYGRTYTGHALDGMQEGGIPPMVVEEVIAGGQTSPGNTPGSTVHSAQGVQVITNQAGSVVTVHYIGK